MKKKDGDSTRRKKNKMVRTGKERDKTSRTMKQMKSATDKITKRSNQAAEKTKNEECQQRTHDKSNQSEKTR